MCSRSSGQQSSALSNTLAISYCLSGRPKTSGTRTNLASTAECTGAVWHIMTGTIGSLANNTSAPQFNRAIAFNLIELIVYCPQDITSPADSHAMSSQADRLTHWHIIWRNTKSQPNYMLTAFHIINSISNAKLGTSFCNFIN